MEILRKLLPGIPVCFLCMWALITLECKGIPWLQEKFREEYRYTVLDKSKEISSHYNILTNKQVISTDYIVIFKSEKNKVIAHKCELSEYYSYEVGTTYIFYHEID